MKVLLFVGLLVIILVMLSGNIQEGLAFPESPYDGATKKKELIYYLTQLREMKHDEFINSPALTPKGKTDMTSTYISGIGTKTLFAIRTSDFFTDEVKLALKDTVDNNKDNSTTPTNKKVDDNTTMADAVNRLQNKINANN
jgi:hypothetical protein